MPRRKDPDKERAKREARQQEMQKDTVYQVRFLRKGAPKYGAQPSDYFAPVEVPSDPEKNPAMLAFAIEQFQSRQDVPDWQQVAERYEFSSYYYP